MARGNSPWADLFDTFGVTEFFAARRRSLSAAVIAKKKDREATSAVSLLGRGSCIVLTRLYRAA